MRKRIWKRLASMLLALVLCVQLLPTAALAAVGTLLGNDSVTNAALLEALQDLYGEDAEAYMALLEQYGLLDENGQLVTDEKVTVDGVEYTLDELTELLDDPDTDLSRVAEVDGEYITLEDLKLIVEIERYLAYVQATYFTPQDLTDEQVENFYDLADAWSSGQVLFAAGEEDTGPVVGPSGISHSARVHVTDARDGTFTVALTGAAAGQEVSFDWEAQPGSLPASDSGHVDLTADADGTAETKIEVTLGAVSTEGDDPVRSSADLTYYLKLEHLDGALFSNGKSAMSVQGTTSGNVQTMPGPFRYNSGAALRSTGRVTGEPDKGDNVSAASYPTYTFSEQEQKSFAWGIVNQIQVGLGGDVDTTVVATFQVLDSSGENYWDVTTVTKGAWLTYGEYTNGGSLHYLLTRSFNGGTPTGLGTGQTTLHMKDHYTAVIFDELEVAGSTVKVGTNLRKDPVTATTGKTETLSEYILKDLTEIQLAEYEDTYDVTYVLTWYSAGNAHVDRDTEINHKTVYYDLPSLTFSDGKAPEVLDVTAPEGTYYPGQVVPVTVTFSEPVSPKGAYITINSVESGSLLSGSGALTNVLTFAYEVQPLDNAGIYYSDIYAKDQSGNACDISYENVQIGGVTLVTPDKLDAFSDITAEVDMSAMSVLKIIATLNQEDKKYSTWALAEMAQNDDNALNSMQVTVDGKEFFTFYPDDDQNPTAVIASIPLEYDGTELNGVAELYLDGILQLGRGYPYTVQKAVPVTQDDLIMAAGLSKNGKLEDNDDVEIYSPYEIDGKTYPAEIPVIYADKPILNMLAILMDERNGFTWGDLDKVSYYRADSTVAPMPDGSEPQFAWRASDPTVATISPFDYDGDSFWTVIPTGKAGKTEITLVAFNGGPDLRDGTVVGLPDAESKPLTMTFDVGTEPFLMIPASGKTVSIREEQDAVVNWTSNLCAKNTAENLLTFHTTLRYEVNGTEQTTELEPIEVRDGAQVSSVTVPWSTLAPLFDQGVRRITVEVYAEFMGEKYGTYSYTDEDGNVVRVENATATISMVSQPAVVTLHPTDLYRTDKDGEQDIPLTWDVEHLDTTVSGGGQFELYVASTNKSFGTNGILSVTGAEAGLERSYTLQIPKVTVSKDDPTSYRDTYSITIKAKNSAESTWSYSSYVMYVYSHDVLQILLDGEQAGENLTMSNIDRIKKLWGGGGETGSEAIVALQRDIALKNVISINYGDYAWAELADQIAWKSTDSSVAAVNYQQGTLYENIEEFSYTSYRPGTDFILSGLKDGTTTVTATHVKTGITDTLNVEVETLRDQLYLFQCYPKAVTTLTYEAYTNAARTATDLMTLDTDENGEAAIYAPYGIAGDVYCHSEVRENNEDITYVGTIYNRNLVSSEEDSTKLRLYPVNTLQLRRAAQAEIYLKNPDGTPYVGQVTFRGGVYRNGEYCLLDNVRFGLQDEDRSSWQTGENDHTASTGADGRLLVTMDLQQFKTTADQADIQPGEKLYYIFQLEYGSGDSTAYYPLLLRVDATLNLEDIAASGDSIVAWEANDAEGQAAHPFVAMQTLKYSEKASANVADVRKSDGSVGPSTTFPTAYLTTTLMWWGDEEAAEAGRVNSVTLRDKAGAAPESQLSQKKEYPFSDMTFTEHTLTLDQTVMDAWGMASGDERAVELVLSKTGEQADRIVALPFQMVNMIGVQEAEDSETLTTSLYDIKNNLKVSGGNGIMGSGMDALLLGGMQLLSGDAGYDSSQDAFAVRLFATSDPKVFRAFFCLNVGNMGSGGNVTGVYPEYTDQEDMFFAEANAGGDLDKFPSVINVYRMAKGTYLENVIDEGVTAYKGQATRGINFDLGGYFEADFSYNSATRQWECHPISGGFHAGGGLNYSWYVNTMVGPVPVNISLTLGATLQVSMDMQRGNYYTKTQDMVVWDLNQFGSVEELEAQAAQDEAEGRMVVATGSDYLTTLRIFLYARIFAGVGFDYSVLAFKIGVFGQLNVDFTFEWLNRSYLGSDDKQNVSAVGPLDTRQDAVMDGQRLRFSGSTGIEFVFKFLFISYEKVFCSVGFSVGGNTGDWEEIQDIWAANKTINNRPVTRMAMPNGQVLYAVDLGAQLESRDYVDAAEQEWVGGRPGISLFSLDQNQDATLAKALQTGAYSYADPVLSDDGQVMFYLSDRGTGDYADATDLTNTRVAVSTKSRNGLFQEGTRFDSADSVPVGYGDSSVKLVGTAGGYAAVWVRQMEDYTLTEGDGGATEGVQMLQFNSTEIIAAVSTDGTDWTLKRLTDNTTPDLAPVAATNGTRTVVAWREVNSSGAATITNFDQQDAVRFAVYEDGKWSETQTLYDGSGTNAAVKGIEAAMLSDGTAAVVYTLDTDAANDVSTDWETVLAVISDGQDADSGKEEDAVRTFQLTTDSNLDDNPQITTASFDDGGERFVVAWHTEQAIANSVETESDIRLAVVDAQGVHYEKMPESLSQATAGTGDTVGSNFRFVKNADSIEDLSILWVDSVSGDADGTTYSDLADGVAGGYQNVGHDVLKAVKFVESGGSFTVSGTVEVAAMDENTLIDHFDAYVSDRSANEIKSVILGTDYSQTTTKTVTVSDGKTEYTAEMTVANPISGMYTATAKFESRIEETAVMLEYDQLYPNSDIDVQFTIRNSGKDAVTGLTITSGSGVNKTTVYTTDSDPLYGAGGQKLNLLPNRDITVTARFPIGAEIQNTPYTITAAFADGTTAELSDTLYLDIPDVGVSKIEITKEADGERTLRYALYNGLNAKLADAEDGWQVHVGFYADQSCTEPLTGKDGQALVSTISSESDLALIDAGGYSAEVTIPLDQFVENQELPQTGVNVYAKAWIEKTDAKTRADDPSVVSEYYTGNNMRSFTLDNLAVRRGETVTIQYALENNGTGSQVAVELQYNKLTGTETGNVIVTLLDKDGNVLEQQQTYSTGTAGNGLISLSREGTWNQTFTFSKQGDQAVVTYSDLILDSGNAELDNLIFSNIPGVTLASFEQDADGVYRAAVSTDDLTSTTVIASTASANAKIRLSTAAEGTGSNTLAETVTLVPGETNTITVIVTNGTDSKTCILTVQNNGEPVISDPTGTPDPGETSQYSASTFYAADSAVISLNAVASGNYQLAYQWYSCDADGSNTAELENETASTLTIPNTTDVGVYYYRCKVTRSLVSGGTVDYWSSVATVQIKKATDNSVNLMGATVDFDNKPHGLTSAAAAKEGSTLYYSTDGGKTWSETAPEFTSVGTHTIWVYASNPNYEDTTPVTADVVIREKEGTLFKLETQEVSEVFSSYPESIRETYSDAAGLEAALKTEVVKLGAAETDTEVYEIKLLFSLDDGETWQEATEKNFPAAGVTVELLYPEGTDRYRHSFILQHLITNPLNTGKTVGDFETMDITLTETGIRFTADCLSPFVLGWYLRPTSSGSTAYNVAVADAEHGSVTVKPKRASYNSTVTITAAPDDGYQVGSVTVTTQNGRKLTVTDAGGGTYTFKMPAASVSVQITFVPVSSVCDGGQNCPSRAFTDLSTTAWYHEAVDYALTNSLMGGYGNGIFGPDNTLSRAMLAQILYNREGRPAVSQTSPFSDVADGAWYTDAVIWANANGIVSGYGNGLFGPNDPITREQLAVMLWRYAGSPASTHSLDAFLDANQVSGYAVDAVRWANENGIVNGYDDKTLRPGNNATRAQVAQMLMNFLK